MPMIFLSTSCLMWQTVFSPELLCPNHQFFQCQEIRRFWSYNLICYILNITSLKINCQTQPNKRVQQWKFDFFFSFFFFHSNEPVNLKGTTRPNSSSLFSRKPVLGWRTRAEGAHVSSTTCGFSQKPPPEGTNRKSDIYTEGLISEQIPELTYTNNTSAN